MNRLGATRTLFRKPSADGTWGILPHFPPPHALARAAPARHQSRTQEHESCRDTVPTRHSESQDGSDGLGTSESLKLRTKAYASYSLCSGASPISKPQKEVLARGSIVTGQCSVIAATCGVVEREREYM